MTSEMESLNIEDLDVDQLERRVELSSMSVITNLCDDGGGCDSNCTQNNSPCVGDCASLCGCNGACGVNGSCGVNFW